MPLKFLVLGRGGTLGFGEGGARGGSANFTLRNRIRPLSKQLSPAEEVAPDVSLCCLVVRTTGGESFRKGNLKTGGSMRKVR